MLMIRPWRARSGLSMMTRGRTPGARRADGGGARLPRMRTALVWRRPRRLGHAPSTPPGSKPVTLDVRHRIKLLMRWTSEIKSFNERVARTVQGWTPRGPEMRRDIAEGRSRQPAALRLLVRVEGAKMGWVSRVSSPPRLAIGAAADSGTSLRRAAPPARHLAGGGAHWHVQPPSAPAVAYRRRSLGIAQLFPALKRVIARQARGAVSLQRHPGIGNALPLTGQEPRASPARLFAAATLALSGTASKSQTSAPVRVARAVRPVELAWRNNSASSPPAESDAALQRPWSVAARETAAIDVHSRIPVLGETLLSDTRSVNRLAEEVLGRFERKLRVERERRGR